jgi:hypothetical protein
MEATNLETSPEAMEAVVKWQELSSEELNMDNIGSLED